MALIILRENGPEFGQVKAIRKPATPNKVFCPLAGCPDGFTRDPDLKRHLFFKHLGVKVYCTNPKHAEPAPLNRPDSLARHLVGDKNTTRLPKLFKSEANEETPSIKHAQEVMPTTSSKHNKASKHSHKGRSTDEQGCIGFLNFSELLEKTVQGNPEMCLGECRKIVESHFRRIEVPCFQSKEVQNVLNRLSKPFDVLKDQKKFDKELSGYGAFEYIKCRNEPHCCKSRSEQRILGDAVLALSADTTDPGPLITAPGNSHFIRFPHGGPVFPSL